MDRFGIRRGNPFHLQSPQRGKFLAGLLVLALVGGVIHSFTTPLARTGSPREKPRAVAGLLDASGWDFSQGNLRLDGEWELYFGRLLEPADFASLPPGAMTGYVPVPGSWRSARTDDGPPPRHGAATYRLRLTGLPTLPGHAPWALEIPYARTAYRLWVNDVLVASNGEVSDDPAAMRPQYKPLVVPLPMAAGSSTESTAGEPVQLVLQISNAHFRSGAVPKSLTLGPAEQVHRERQERLIAQIFFMGAIALMALYFGMTYAWRATEPSLLYFSLLSGTIAVRTFITGELPVVTVFPNIPWELQLRMEYWTSCIGPATFMLSLYSLFPHDTSLWIKRFWVTVGVVGGILALVLPVRFSSLAVPYYTVLAATLIPYVGYVLARAAWNRREAAELTLVGGLIFLLSVVLTMFHYNQLWVALDWVPAGVFALLVSQALALSRRYALAFRRETELAHQNALLLEEARRRLAERNRLYRLLTQQDEKTRRHIAELLHGRTQARLFAASQQAAKAAALAPVHPLEASRLMRSVEELVEQVRTEDIRDASHQLHPAAIRAGLVGALDSLLAHWPDQETVHLSVDDELAALDDPAGPRLRESLRLGLYRIAEEALNNIRRHARASRVELSQALVHAGGFSSQEDPGGVSPAGVAPDHQPSVPGHQPSPLEPARPAPEDLRNHTPCIELVIANDGAGFDPHTTQPGLGLQLIAARAADLGGRWELRSAPGQGTRLRVVVPLELEEPHLSSTSQGTTPLGTRP